MKRLLSWFLLLPIILSAIGTTFIVLSPQNVSADALSGLSVICDGNNNNSSDIIVNGSAYTLPSRCLKVEILSRSKIRVTLPEDSDRRLNPVGSNQTKMGIFAGTFSRPKFQTLLFEDNDTPTQITLNNVGITQQLTGNSLADRWDVLDADDIRKLFDGASFKITADNQGSELGGADFCQTNDGTDSYFGLQREKRYWDCYETGGDNYVFSSLKDNLIGELANFNITHTASTDGKKLVSVFDGNDVDKDSFVFCETGAYANNYALEDCSGPREGYTLSATPATFTNAESTLVTVEAPGKTTFRTRVGGTTSPSAQTSTSTGTTLNSLPPEDDNDCEGQGGALAWIMCSVIRVLDAGISKLDNQIDSLLLVSEENITGNSDEAQKMQIANKQIRNFAYIILIPIMLVMVIGTALGFELLSAYTVKKAFPRMVAATIFIALSSQITLFIIQFTNTLGRGIAGLILGALTTGDTTLASIINQSNAGAVTGVVFLGASAALLALGPAVIGIMLSYALVTFVALLIAFAVLAVRQVMVLVLALLAPLAILAWIFPGNDKLWKLWWGTFTKLLLMYPLIALLIASGKVFSSYTFNAQAGLLGTFVAVTAYIAPYFFIPKTFQWAGGMFGAIAGVANNRGKGLFDRQKTKRAEIAGKSWQKTKEGSQWGGGRLGRVSQRFSAPGSVLPGRFGAKSKSRMSTTVSATQNQYAKQLQELGLQDDTAGNEFIKHGGSLGSLQKRIAELKNSGDPHDASTASNLSAYAQFAGNRGAILGAAKLNAGFGKLSDGAIEAVATHFGPGQADQAALGAAFGDLVFTSKNAGNYGTYAAKLEKGKIKSYSLQKQENPSEAMDNLAKKLKDGGPSVVGNLKPYKDSTSGFEMKDETISALAYAASQGNEGSLDQLASVGAPGSYTDPTTRAAAHAAAREAGVKDKLDARIASLRERDPRADGRETE